ncbi:hypothetical protein [Streptomyces albidus (ex Kaewkla and Franco 2022)]|uniref:hypothetical protein n=1 Tax=Streptomyces albidus (ex Kaewkla and Franco 2022) TaxID=722709 RepID=UPI0015EED6FB|nr:hypothetical protein [Streptomyces albidus (ex Kaewkla and Franco 2022)]
MDSAPLARLLDSWSTGKSSRTADELARLLAENEQDGPIHLVRILAAIEAAARETGGSLAHLTDTPAITATCGGTLHYLVEILNGSGLRAATTAARTLDNHSRYLVLTALRPYWGAPLRVITGTRPHDAYVMSPKRLWKS